jgi:hypothetical protein
LLAQTKTLLLLWVVHISTLVAQQGETVALDLLSGKINVQVKFDPQVLALLFYTFFVS